MRNGRNRPVLRSGRASLDESHHPLVSETSVLPARGQEATPPGTVSPPIRYQSTSDDS